MFRNMMLSKIHRATITFRDLNYIGSITIDKNLLETSGIVANEKVEVYNIDNGQRFATYVIEGEAGSGIIGVNGAAARLVSIGDKVIIVNYGWLGEREMEHHKANIIVIENEDNTKFYRVK